jgi:mono/diheme cytochrome c family protein
MSGLAKRGGVRAAAALVLAAAGLALAGCGSADSSSSDLAAGEQTFKNLCSSCHTLEAAGTPPTGVGPSLDDSFRAARQVGMSDSQFQGVVRRWIEIAQLPMPRNLVTGKDADDVAAYIASVAGTSDESAPFPYQSTPAVPDPPRPQPHQDD